jgi:hypothetical protein
VLDLDSVDRPRSGRRRRSRHAALTDSGRSNTWGSVTAQSRIICSFS